LRISLNIKYSFSDAGRLLDPMVAIVIELSGSQFLEDVNIPEVKIVKEILRQHNEQKSRFACVCCVDVSASVNAADNLLVVLSVQDLVVCRFSVAPFELE
jgi:hypothetical protein